MGKQKTIMEKVAESRAKSVAKLNTTLVNQSKGLGKKFVNHSKALMQGYNETIDEDGASFGEDLASDGKNDPFDSVVEYSSPVKSAASEAADALKKTRVKREGNFQNESGDALDVYDITEKGEDVVQPYSKDWDIEAAGGLTYEEWIKQPGNQEKEDAFVESMTTPGEDKKSVEMNVRPEEKEEVKEGEKANYNMGWMESRNAKRARRVQLRDAKKKTRQYNRLIKKWERKGGSSEDEKMPPEVRAAYAHFTKDGATSKFDTPIGSTTGVNKPSETIITKGNEPGAEDAITLDSSGKPIEKKNEEAPPTKFLGAGALGMAGKALIKSGAGKKLLKGAAGALGLGGIMYKQPGKSLPANFKDFGKRK